MYQSHGSPSRGSGQLPSATPHQRAPLSQQSATTSQSTTSTGSEAAASLEREVAALTGMPPGMAASAIRRSTSGSSASAEPSVVALSQATTSMFALRVPSGVRQVTPAAGSAHATMCNSPSEVRMLLHGGMRRGGSGGASREQGRMTLVCISRKRSSGDPAANARLTSTTNMATRGASAPPLGLDLERIPGMDSSAYRLRVPAGERSEGGAVPILHLHGQVPPHDLHEHSLTPLGPTCVLATGGRLGNRPQGGNSVWLYDCAEGVWYEVEVPARLDGAGHAPRVPTSPGQTTTPLAHVEPTPSCPPLATPTAGDGATALQWAGGAGPCPGAQERVAHDISLGTVGCLQPLEDLTGGALGAFEVSAPQHADSSAAFREAFFDKGAFAAVKKLSQQTVFFMQRRNAVVVFGGHHSRGKHTKHVFVLQLPPRQPRLPGSPADAADALQPSAPASAYPTATAALAALLHPTTAWYYQECSGAPTATEWRPFSAPAAGQGGGAGPVQKLRLTYAKSAGQVGATILRRWVRTGPPEGVVQPEGHPGVWPLVGYGTAPPTPTGPVPAGSRPPTYALQEFLACIGGKNKHDEVVGAMYLLNLHSWVWQRHDLLLAPSMQSAAPFAAPRLFGHIAHAIPGSMQVAVVGGASVLGAKSSLGQPNHALQLVDVSAGRISRAPPAMGAETGGVGDAGVVLRGRCAAASLVLPPSTRRPGALTILTFGGQDVGAMQQGEGASTVPDPTFYALSVRAAWEGGAATPIPCPEPAGGGGSGRRGGDRGPSRRHAPRPTHHHHAHHQPVHHGYNMPPHEAQGRTPYYGFPGHAPPPHATPWGMPMDMPSFGAMPMPHAAWAANVAAMTPDPYAPAVPPPAAAWQGGIAEPAGWSAAARSSGGGWSSYGGPSTLHSWGGGTHATGSEQGSAGVRTCDDRSWSASHSREDSFQRNGAMWTSPAAGSAWPAPQPQVPPPQDVRSRPPPPGLGPSSTGPGGIWAAGPGSGGGVGSIW